MAAQRVFNWVGERWRSWVPYVALTAIMIYTADQLFTSERGLMTWRIMRQQVAQLEADIAGLNEDIARLNSNLDRLRGPLVEGRTRGTPDTDFIDELLRKDLGLLKDGEVVILLPQGPADKTDTL